MPSPQRRKQMDRMTRSLRLGLMVGLLAFNSTQLSADDSKQRDQEKMQASMAAILADPAQRDAAAAAGQDRGMICAYCHGKTGISLKDWIPNMAGQSAKYILDQSLAYATGKREHGVMNDLSSSMTDEELINLSVFYATQEAEVYEQIHDEEIIRAGRDFYRGACKRCHGVDGRGKEGYTWIAGQKPEYVRRALSRYRNGVGGRINEKMAEVTQNMPDELINSVALYLTTLK